VKQIQLNFLQGVTYTCFLSHVPRLLDSLHTASRLQHLSWGTFSIQLAGRLDGLSVLLKGRDPRGSRLLYHEHKMVSLAAWDFVLSLGHTKRKFFCNITGQLFILTPKLKISFSIENSNIYLFR